MRKSRFTDEQVVAMLREADRTSMAEPAKKHKVSEQTIYVRRKHFAGLTPADMRSTWVIDVLTRLMSVHGAPVYLRSDSGPEFVSNAILQWLTDALTETAIIDPGKPWKNSTNESFNGKFRDECLSVEWFRLAAKPRSSSRLGGGTTTPCVHIRALPT